MDEGIPSSSSSDLSHLITDDDELIFVVIVVIRPTPLPFLRHIPPLSPGRSSLSPSPPPSQTLPKISSSPSPPALPTHSPSPTGSTPTLPAPPTILEGSGDVSSGESEAKPPTPAAPSSEDSGDVMPTAPEAKIHSPAPSAPASSSEGSGDVTPAAPAPSVRSPGPPAPSGDVSSGESEAKPPTPAAPSSEDSGDVTPTAPEAKIHSPAPSAPAPSSEGSGDVPPAAPAAPEAKIAPSAPAPSPEGSGDVTPAAPEAKTSSPPTPAPSVHSPGPIAPPPSSQGSEHVFSAASEVKIQSSASPAPAPSSEGLGDASEAKMPSLPAPGSIVRSPGPPVSAHPSSSDAPQVLSAPLKPPQHTLRVSPPPDRPLWILPPPTTNLWEPNSKYFTLVDDTWYADESSLCPAGYVYREREGGFLRHDRGPTSPPLPSTTSRSLRDSDVIVIDDVEVNPVVASGSADYPIAIDVDIDGGVPMDVDPPQVSYSKNGDGNKGDGDYTMADLPVSNDNDNEDEEDEDEDEEDEGIAFEMTEEQHQLAEWIKDHHVPTWGPVPYHIYHVRCKRGFERTTVKRINDDIASETIPLNLIRAAFISQYPGRFYLQARSMLPGNTPLALYLNLIPNLIYP
ncbi:hypothetical protein EV360DRAFT_90106, partial [Lentinula raphanica]